MDLTISQNFIRDRKLIENILKKTNISSKDIVLDIGSGKGVLIFPLSNICKQVIAYEIDEELAEFVARKIDEENINNAEVINRDFLSVDLHKLGEYKVFSNIPFSQSALIVKKLLITSPFPSSCYIFLEKNTAYRFMGINGESIVSLSIKINFASKIIHQFTKYDFDPVPKADIVLVEFIKRNEENRSLGQDDISACTGLISRIFLKKKHDVKGGLLTEFSYIQVKRIQHEIGIDLRKKISMITIDEWIKIFNIWKKIGKN